MTPWTLRPNQHEQAANPQNLTIKLRREPIAHKIQPNSPPKRGIQQEYQPEPLAA